MSCFVCMYIFIIIACMCEWLLPRENVSCIIMWHANISWMSIGSGNLSIVTARRRTKKYHSWGQLWKCCNKFWSGKCPALECQFKMVTETILCMHSRILLQNALKVYSDCLGEGKIFNEEVLHIHSLLHTKNLWIGQIGIPCRAAMTDYPIIIRYAIKSIWSERGKWQLLRSWIVILRPSPQNIVGFWSPDWP